MKTGTVRNGGYSRLGKIIKKKLIDKNMTATQLAQQLDVKPQYLNDILHGRRSGKKYWKKIEKILEIEIAA